MIPEDLPPFWQAFYGLMFLLIGTAPAIWLVRLAVMWLVVAPPAALERAYARIRPRAHVRARVGWHTPGRAYTRAWLAAEGKLVSLRKKTGARRERYREAAA